jgi:uncharacterized membrane protein YeiH
MLYIFLTSITTSDFVMLRVGYTKIQLKRRIIANDFEILNLFGTMAFAVTGAFKAIEHNADLVGVIVLSSITGVAGGVVRDIIFGKLPPTALINPSYLIVTIASGIAIFFFIPL